MWASNPSQYATARSPLLGLGAEQDRRSTRLDRLRIAPHGAEVDKLAVIFGDFLGPDFLHRLDALAQNLPALFEIGAVIFHLLGVPATADAEDDAAVGDDVERRDLFRQHDRIALDDEADTGAELDALGGYRGGGQSNELIVRVPILGGQITAARPGRLAVGRDVGVLVENSESRPRASTACASSTG